mgnify:CR=1 FL=1
MRMRLESAFHTSDPKFVNLLTGCCATLFQGPLLWNSTESTCIQAGSSWSGDYLPLNAGHDVRSEGVARAGRRAAMSARKRCLFALLATMLAFVAVGSLNVHSKDFDVPTLNSRQAGLARSGPASLWYMAQPAGAGRGKAFRAKTEIAQTDFLPVQSRDVKNLGAGKLLVASRDLADPNFAETVVLLVHYDDQGAAGLILNRRTNVPLSRVLDLQATKDRSDPVYLGGPVSKSAVLALFQSPAKVKGAEHVFGEVYLISTKTSFEQTISAQPDPGVFHVYLGYAGWNNEQLQREVELGSWFIFPADAGTVFTSDPDSMWSQMIQKTELKLVQSKPLKKPRR